MILLLDNYDSFTWNLFDYLAQLGCHVLIKRNDETSVAEIEQLNPEAIVISPGPRTPFDAGILMDVIHHFHQIKPMLGICLGYQALGCYFGAQLIKSKIPVHGKTSAITHNHDEIFHDIPSPTNVMRYHSLNIAAISDDIKIIAETNDGEFMALKHISLPLYGFQFHPESMLTEYGINMMRNWYHLIQ